MESDQKYYFTKEKLEVDLLGKHSILQHFTDIQAVENGKQQKVQVTGRIHHSAKLNILDVVQSDPTKTACNFIANGIRYVEIQYDRLLFLEKAFNSFCLTVYALSLENTNQISARVIANFKNSESDLISCPMANLIIDKNLDPFYRSVLRVVLLCDYTNEKKIHIFRNIGSTTAKPQISILVNKSQAVKRIETVMCKGLVFMVYLTADKILQVINELIDVNQESQIDSSKFTSFPGNISVH